jgi:MerR family transcriptional regulator, thiopeptide resistance regulator
MYRRQAATPVSSRSQVTSSPGEPSASLPAPFPAPSRIIRPKALQPLDPSIASHYRYYTEAEQRRLERIGHFREAGLTLKEIRAVLSSGGKPGTGLLEERLRQTGDNIIGLKQQQRLLAGMLRQVASGKRPPTVDVRLWVKMLSAAGMDEDGMHRWHGEFERLAPDGHQEFLLSLGIPPDEVEEVRRLSRGAWSTNRTRHI